MKNGLQIAEIKSQNIETFIQIQNKSFLYLETFFFFKCIQCDQQFFSWFQAEEATYLNVFLVCQCVIHTFMSYSDLHVGSRDSHIDHIVWKNASKLQSHCFWLPSIYFTTFLSK